MKDHKTWHWKVLWLLWVCGWQSMILRLYGRWCTSTSQNTQSIASLSPLVASLCKWVSCYSMILICICKMTRRIKIRERCWNNKWTWGECDSNLIANNTRNGYCNIKRGGNIQQCEYHGIVMLLDKQLAFIEAKAKEYFQLHNEPQKTCCEVLKVIPWSYVLQKIFKPWVYSLAIHTMTKQMWESSQEN